MLFCGLAAGQLKKSGAMRRNSTYKRGGGSSPSYSKGEKMNLEKLKQMLENGEITQEQFEAMAAALGLNEPEDQPNDPESDPDDTDENERLEKMIQKAVDRATNKLGNDNKNLREQLEKLKKEKLSEEELRKLEAEEKEKELQERENAVKDSENKLYAIKAIKKAGLDDGSETALDILDMVKGPDEASTDANIKALKALVDRLVKAEVEKTFKGNGRTPETGAGAVGGEDNPYLAANFNLTKQMELENSNPELAKKYRAAAGIK